MLRRMVRSPGFLARFILDDPNARPDIDDDAADDNWTSLIPRRYDTAPAAGESARQRFDAYLETLHKAIGLEEQIAAYDSSSRNRDVVTRGDRLGRKCGARSAVYRLQHAAVAGSPYRHHRRPGRN